MKGRPNRVALVNAIARGRSPIPLYDRSKTIVANADDVEHTLLIAFALVVMVILAFLGRATDTFIPVVALPPSMLVSFSRTKH